MAKNQSKSVPVEGDKDKILEATTSQIEKKFGKGAIMKLGESAADLDIQVIPTGSLALDAALGIGGVPRGRIIEIYGPESSGKTTLALQILAEAQAAGGVVAFIDAELPSIRSMLQRSASTLTRFSSPSPTRASKALKSATCWCAPTPLTASWSTPSPPWFPRQKSKERLAIPPWACRPVS